MRALTRPKTIGSVLKFGCLPKEVNELRGRAIVAAWFERNVKVADFGNVNMQVGNCG